MILARTTPPSFSTVACRTQDEAFSLELSVETFVLEGHPPLTTKIPIDPCSVYSNTYVEARQKFRRAATTAGADLHTLTIPVAPEQSLDVLSGGAYTIDIAVLKGNGPGLVVHTSGVHGVEAYAGSPIQIAFLESIVPQLTISNKLPKTFPTIVLIHAVNPYGMAHYKRTNEHNVDLNRNGLHPDEWASVVQPPVELEHHTTKSPYEAYARLTSYFNPPGPPSWLYLFVTLWTTMAEALVQHGFDALKAAMVTGQYTDPLGIFYGGNSLQPSLQLVWEFFANTLLVADTKDSDSNVEVMNATTEDERLEDPSSRSTNTSSTASRQCCTGTVTWIDVHTGLGPSGEDTLLTDWEASSYAAQQAPRWFPGAQTPLVSKDAKEVSKGYDNARGFTTAFFRRLFEETKHSNNDDDDQASSSSSSYLAVAQEFGTVPAILVAHALILENRAFHYLPVSESVEWAKQTTKRAFYKETPEWRRSILDRGLTLMLQAIRRSSAVDEGNDIQQAA